MKSMKPIGARVTLVLVASLIMTPLIGRRASAATAPTMGTAGSFAVLAGSTVTNTGPTVINGELGVSPGSAVTGFPPGTVNPTGSHTPPGIHKGDGVAAQAQSDLTIAYNNLAGQACSADNNLSGDDLGGLTLVPGTYCFDSSAQLTGALTLNVQGNPDSVFVFQIGSTLTTASNSSVVFINGSTCNVYWQIGSSATLGTDTDFQGSILALTSITANTTASVEGRLLARNGAVTLDSNTVNRPSCGTPTSTTTPTPTATSTPGATATETSTPGATPTETPPAGTPSSPTSTVIGPETVIPAGTVISPGDIVFNNAPGATGTTTAAPTSSANPSQAGQEITLTTAVTSGGSGPVASGLVTFIDGSTVLGTVRLDGRGMATFKTSSLSAGDHSIIAVYHGNQALAGSISRALLQKVQAAPRSGGTSRTGLPGTGVNALPLGLSGSGSILLGIALLIEDRRRTKGSFPPLQAELKEQLRQLKGAVSGRP